MNSVRPMSAATATAAKKPDRFIENLKSEIAGIRAAGTYKKERVITTPMAAKLSVANVPVSIALLAPSLFIVCKSKRRPTYEP
jgi:hypothetical protein